MRQPIHPSVKTSANQIQIEANEMVELRKIFAELCARQTGQLLDVVQNDLERDRYPYIRKRSSGIWYY